MFRTKLFERHPLHVGMDRAAGYTAFLFCALAFSVLYILSRYNYNLFHALADIFTIVIASTVFVIAWNSRGSLDNDYLLYAGIAFLSFAFLDLFHVLGNKNMGVFPQYGNLGPTLYIASRYVLSISLVTAPLFINRRLRAAPVLAAYSLVTLLVLLSVFYWQNFPVCFVEGVGLTTFKVMSDYIICLILLAALVLLLLNRRSFDARVLRLLAASILLSIATGLAFTLYADPFGLMNAIGHFFQIISFYLIYLAVIETSLTKPQNILFRKLKQSEEKYRTLFQNMAEEVHFWQLVRDAHGLIKTWRLVDVNPPALKTWGRQSVDEIRGKTTDEIFGPGATEHYLSIVQQITTEGVPHSFEDYFPNLDKYFRFTSVPLGEYFITTGADVTGVKKAELALRESEQRFRIAEQLAKMGHFEWDVVNNVIVASPSLERIYGLEPGSFKGRYEDWLTMVYCEDRTRVYEIVQSAFAEKRREERFEFRIVRPDGDVRWNSLQARATYDESGRPLRVMGAMTDITDTKKAQEELKKSRDELENRVQDRTAELSQALEKLRVENIQCKLLEDTLRESENQVRFFASQCLTAQETERKRVAGELHDSIAASLGAIRLRIDRVAEEMKQGPCGPESLQDIASEVTVINQEVRRIMADLRPSILDDLGIIPALTWLCREYQKTYSHISVDSQIGVSEEEVPDSLKTPIFRICQEAMNNIAKHSKASLVSLCLQQQNGRMELSVQDNGQGFDLETVKKGMGLSTMKERAQLSGGSFDLETAKGKGTIIRASWTV